jgi:hypothetical protein
MKKPKQSAADAAADNAAKIENTRALVEGKETLGEMNARLLATHEEDSVKKKETVTISSPAPGMPPPVTLDAAAGARLRDDTKRLTLDVGVFRRMASAIAHAVPKDEDHPLYACLHVVQDGLSLLFEATNGHWFARWVTAHEAPAAEFLIPGDRLGAFLRLLPKSEDQLFLFDAQLVTLAPRSMTGPGVKLDYASPEGEYPALSSVIRFPSRGFGMSYVTLAPEYLMAAAKVLDVAGSAGVRIDIGRGPQDLVTLTADGIDGLVIGIMPRRDSEDAAEAAE